MSKKANTIKELWRKLLLRVERQTAPFILAVRRPLVVITQLASVLAAYYLAFNFRFEFSLPDKEFNTFLLTVIPLIACRAISFGYFRLYSGMWRYVTLADLSAILKGCFSGSAIFVGFILLWKGHSLAGIPRSVLVLEPLLSVLILTAIRISIRIYRENFHRPVQQASTRRALIVGAGNWAISLARFLLADPTLGVKLEGFLDDDKNKQGIRILGRPVLGAIEDLDDVVSKLNIGLVLVVMRNAPLKKIKDVQERCRLMKISCRILRSPEEIIAERQRLAHVAEVKPDQVMHREIISFPQTNGLKKNADRRGKVVLVSGAAGSIGAELCRQIATQDPELLVMLDQNESGLYDIEQELSRRAPEVKTQSVLLDITNQAKVDWAMDKYRPGVVYHAAAYKHVPMMESESLEALTVNVLGSYYLGKAALRAGVERFVFVSTDKAVNPVSVMGMTKLMAERILLSLGNDRTKFAAVRFGNVLDSNGSVVPLFRRQIEEGGPVTVTHPDCSRFFMSLEEAVNLVMSAGGMGKGGEVFLLDMGKSVKIIDVALHVIGLAGLEPEGDIEIKYIGLRPGEKLHEELYWRGEGVKTTTHPRINYVQKEALPELVLQRWVQRCQEIMKDWDGEKVRQLLKEFVEQELKSSLAETNYT